MKQTITILILLLTFQHLSFSQDQYLVDSLTQQLKTLDATKRELGKYAPKTNDTLMVNILYQLSKAHWGNHPEKAMDYAKQTLVLSEQIGYKKGVGYAYTSMGVVNRDKGDYNLALEFHQKALKISEEIGDKKGIAMNYLYFGNIYFLKGNYPEALKNYFACIKISDENGDNKSLARAKSNIGNIYFRQGNYPEALKNYSAVLTLFQKIGDKKGIGSSYHNLGNIYLMQQHYPEALKNYSASLKIFEELGDKKSIAKANTNLGLIHRKEDHYPEALKNYFVALKIYEEIGDKEGIADSYNNIGDIYFQQKKYKDASKYLDKALSLSKEIGSLENIKKNNQLLAKLDSAEGNFRQALEHYKIYIAACDSLENEENTKKMMKQQMQYDFDKKESLAKAEQEKKAALSQKEIQKQKWVRNGFIGGFATVLFFALVFFRQRTRISKEKQKSDAEKKRSEELLLNILPYEVAEELKSTGISKAKTYSMVSVMFTDFKDFTRISEKVSSELLVDELNYCFSGFDKILEKYKIEKIKTIGDAYLCASGLPVLNYTHAVDTVNAAFEFRDFILARKKEKEARGEIPFELRIGIHTGPVVAGIVGVKKFAYDIWGDTVNTAARMEQCSEAGKINISGSTYQLVKDKFKCIHRGKIEVKNKDEVDMYFVEPTG